MASLAENTARTIDAFNEIENTITSHGVEMSAVTAVEEYPSKIDEVYNAGVENGYQTGYTVGEESGETKGYNTGYEKGRKDEKNEFWDSYLSNPYDCVNRFGGMGWKSANFYPTKSISPTYAQRMFVAFMIDSGFDLAKRLDDCGITLDFSKCKNLGECFSQAGVSRVGTIDCSSATSISSLFAFCNRLVTIDKLIVTPTLSYSNVFYENYALQNITIEGTIGGNYLNVSWSKNLTHDSLMNIINVLADKTTDTSGTTWKVTLGSTNIAKLTDDELELISEKGWTYG